jgi:hypothetical protein
LSGVAEVAVGLVEDQIGLSVAGDVGERGRLIADAFEDVVLLPVVLPVGIAGVLVPICVGAGEADDEDIGPAVVVEVVNEGEEVLRVGQRLLALDGHERPLHRELWPVVDERAGDQVMVTIFVKVAEVRAFAVEDGGEPTLLKLRLCLNHRIVQPQMHADKRG